MIFILSSQEPPYIDDAHIEKAQVRNQHDGGDFSWTGTTCTTQMSSTTKHYLVKWRYFTMYLAFLQATHLKKSVPRSIDRTPIAQTMLKSLLL